MSEIDLNAKFPELRPIRSVPSLWSVNGCGMFLYGRRAYDEETGSYIQTHCLCLIGIPILTLGAYRIAETNQGKYILGREPMSILAQAFNAMVLLLALGLGGYFGWSAYTGTPEYIARQKLAQADQLAAAGKLAEAARLCREVAQGSGAPAGAAEAIRRVTTILEQPGSQDSAAEQAGVLDVAAALRRAGQWPEPPEALYNRGKAMMDRCRSTDPRGALAILESIAPLAPKGEDVNAVRLGLLESLVAAHPGDMDLVSRLTAAYEAQGQGERAVAILEPLRGKLGTTEGARILGLADAQRGRLDQALALLRPYTRARLDTFHAAETAWTSAHEAAQKRVIEQLKAGPADFDADRYRRSSEAEKSAQLEQYLSAKIKGDPAIDQAQERMLRESSVVSVALELGMILLEHAQNQADPKARKDELDEAEKTFLAVDRLAGQNDAYRLKLAEVYYWQGKHREGRALFDEVLKAQNRDPKLLLGVCELLRRVGSQSEARALSEEAYQAARDPETKQNAAMLRGLLGVELDDKITWLRRSDQSNSQLKAILSGDLAQQALNHGDEAQAIAHFREAIRLYEAMPENAAVLNNSALALLHLSSLTGDQSAYDRGLAKIEKAQKLDPSNSLTMMNAGGLMLEKGLRDIIGTAIDLRALKKTADLEMLNYLYQDQPGRETYARRVRSHAGINRAIALLEKALLLSPRRPDLYKTLDQLYAYRGETEKQRGLLQRLEHIDLDLSDEISRAKDIYAGARKDEMRTEANSAVKRAEAALTAARARKPDRTFAVAAAGLDAARFAAFHVGLDADADDMVALAESADAAAPSYRTRSIVVASLLFRAGRRLARGQPAYAKMAEKTRLSTSDTYLIAIALHGANPLRDAVRQDPDVRRAVDLIREAYHADPKYEADAWTWSLLGALDPDEGARMAQTYIKDESTRISREILQRIDPTSASTALTLYWAAEMLGKPNDGRAILDAYAARGIPLPAPSP